MGRPADALRSRVSSVIDKTRNGLHPKREDDFQADVSPEEGAGRSIPREKEKSVSKLMENNHTSEDLVENKVGSGLDCTVEVSVHKKMDREILHSVAFPCNPAWSRKAFGRRIDDGRTSRLLFVGVAE